MNKAEKRRQLQELKLERQGEKSIRLRQAPVAGNSVRVVEQPINAKFARSSKNPDSIMSDKITWCVTRSDIVGSWTWGVGRAWSNDDWDHLIEPALAEFNNLSWAEALSQITGGKNGRHRKHHDMDVGDLIEEAQDRWKKVGLEQYDTSFRFRLGGTRRLWGFRIKSHFHVVWWDPTHGIYPTKKKGS